MDKATPIGAVVGANIATLRGERGWSQHRTVYELRLAGLEWSRSALSAIEAGRRQSIELDELIVVAAVFEVSIPRLLDAPGRVSMLGGRVSLTVDEIDRAVRGLRVHRPQIDDHELGEEIVSEALADPDDADVRVAGRLGVEVEELRAAAVELWGHSLTKERGKRAGTESAIDDSQRSALGHVTRQLVKEISEHLERSTE